MIKILLLLQLGSASAFVQPPCRRRSVNKPLNLQEYGWDLAQIPKKIVIKDVRVGSIEGLRGVIAERRCGGDLLKSDPLVTVPGNLVFEVTNTRPPTPFPSFVSQTLWEGSMWDQRLAFKLLHELKVVGLVNSDKAFWLKQLPTSYSTPLHWPESIVSQETQYPALAAKVQRQRAEWRAFYDRWMSEKSPEAARVSYDDYLLALECVNSRAFSGTYEGSNAGERQSLLLFTGVLTLAFPLAGFATWEQSLSAAVAVGMSILVKDFFFAKASGLKRWVVCPFVDMFNHKSSVSSDVSYNYFSNVFELRTESHEAGKQVFISYGRQSNDRLLQFYGFCDSDNPFDVYDFGLPVLELLLKFADELPAIPTTPSAETRLRSIAAALRVTEVDDATVRGSKRGDPLRADEVPVRFFRIAPAAGTGTGTGTGTGADAGVEQKQQQAESVEAILKAAAVRRGEGDQGTIARFDSVSTRAIRALYASPAEWPSFAGSENNIGNLEKLGTPLSTQTEALLAQALRKLAALELTSKPTSLEQDLELQSRQPGGSGGDGGGVRRASDAGKGFSVPVVAPSASDGGVAEPSGAFSSPRFSALAFRIEKKKLLREAMS